MMKKDKKFAAYLEIHTPAELIDLIGTIKNAVISGDLVQIFPQDAPFCLKYDIGKLMDEDAFPDYIESYFSEEKTGSLYKLSVETYHGAGGTWSVVD